VAVTVTVKLPLVEAWHESIEAPEPLTLVGVRVQVMPVAGDIVVERLTAPANPLTAAILIVDVPACPTLTATLVGLAEIVKS